MKYGLSIQQWDFLQKNLTQPLKELGSRVFLFGSRARGDHQKFSDIDILYRPHPSQPIDEAKIFVLLEDISDSSFPYKIDLVKDSELASRYREKVESEIIEI